MTVVYAAFVVALGTGLGHGRAALAAPGALATLVALVVTGVSWRRSALVATAAALAAVGLAAAASASWRTAGSTFGVLPGLASRKPVVEVCGDVRSVGRRSLELHVARVERGTTAWLTSEPLRVTGAAVTDLHPGERICAKGELRPPRSGLDEVPLLVADRVGERATSSPLRLSAALVRARFSEAARRALPATQAGLLLGMTDGDTDLIDDATVQDFGTTGLSHLVAVSGYNVAVFLAIVMLVVRAVIRRGRLLRVLAVLPALVFFAFLTGLEPSVLRATVSAGVALAAGAGGRRADALRAAAMAFVVLILAAPDMLFQAGFQLSFGATIGIVLWSEPLARHIGRFLRKDTRLARATASGLGTTIAAQLSVAPLLAWHFGRIPGIGGFANVVAIPLAGIVMLGGLVTLSAASLAPFLDQAPATMRLPLDVILWSAHAFAKVPGASIAVSATGAFALTAALAALLAPSVRMRAGALALVVGLGGAAAGQAIAGSACDAPSVTALDVGQGSAVVLRSGDHAVLVDTGPKYGGVVRELHAAGVHRLDAIFVTHSHIDHALGAIDVMRRLEVDHLFGPIELRWTSGADVIAAANEEGIPFEPKAAGDAFDAGDIHIDVLWPEDGELPPFSQDLIDVNSLVLAARIGDVRVVLPGDVRARQESELVDQGIAAQILVAPHHGSKDLDLGFVDAVDPKITLITVGADNPYGLPAPQAVQAYARHGSVFRTDQDGRVSVCLEPDAPEVTKAK
jgi:competence protein ComEC